MTPEIATWAVPAYTLWTFSVQKRSCEETRDNTRRTMTGKRSKRAPSRVMCDSAGSTDPCPSTLMNLISSRVRVMHSQGSRSSVPFIYSMVLLRIYLNRAIFISFFFGFARLKCMPTIPRIFLLIGIVPCYFFIFSRVSTGNNEHHEMSPPHLSFLQRNNRT